MINESVFHFTTHFLFIIEGGEKGLKQVAATSLSACLKIWISSHKSSRLEFSTIILQNCFISAPSICVT